MTAQKYSPWKCLKNSYLLIICYFILLFTSSCESNKKQKPPLDVEGIKVAYQNVRFDKLVFSMDSVRLDNSIQQLYAQHPSFSEVYFSQLTGFGGNGKVDFLESMHHFLAYKDYKNLYDTVQQHFPDTKKIDADLEKLFKHIKYYYPNEHLGKVYYFISGLNFWSAVSLDSAMAIGLDMYLGKDYPFYAAVQIPSYELINRVPERIPIHAAKSYYEGAFPFEYGGKTLLDMMIYKGKELYFSENVVREATDKELMGYSQESITWCEENAALIYHFLIKKDLLYSTQWQEILPLVNDGPTTAGMPNESPGNVGSWLGWQIVRNYMANHPKTSLQELMTLNIPAQQFLRESQFKP